MRTTTENTLAIGLLATAFFASGCSVDAVQANKPESETISGIVVKEFGDPYESVGFPGGHRPSYLFSLKLDPPRNELIFVRPDYGISMGCQQPDDLAAKIVPGSRVEFSSEDVAYGKNNNYVVPAPNVGVNLTSWSESNHVE